MNTPASSQAADAQQTSSQRTTRAILVVVDPAGPRQACIDKAVRLAVKYRSHLELFVCDTEADLPESLRSALSVWDYRRHVQIRRLYMLETMAEPLRLAGLSVHTSATWCASLAQGIVEFVRHVPADCVVKNRDDTEATRSLLSEADTALTAELSNALLLVRTTAWPESPKVAVASEADGFLIESAASLAEHLGGELDGSNQQPPSIVVMRMPLSPQCCGADPDTLLSLRGCDLLLIKPSCQTNPFG